MSRKLFVIPFLAILLFSTNCSTLYELSVESLTMKLRSQMKNKQFGKIYDDGSNFMHINASRDEFIERISKITEELERVDENINWQPNNNLGKTFSVDTYTKTTYLTSYKRLENDKQKISIFITWEVVNGTQKLDDLTASTSSDSERPFYLITAGKLNKTK